MLIDDTTAALILRRHVECLQRPELECPKDKDCIWDADSAVCEANGGYVLRTISQYPLNEQNPECETVKPLFMAGCTGLDKEPCGAKNSCLWDEKDGEPWCIISFVLLCLLVYVEFLCHWSRHTHRSQRIPQFVFVRIITTEWLQDLYCKIFSSLLGLGIYFVGLCNFP